MFQPKIRISKQIICINCNGPPASTYIARFTDISPPRHWPSHEKWHDSTKPPQTNDRGGHLPPVIQMMYEIHKAVV